MIVASASIHQTENLIISISYYLPTTTSFLNIPYISPINSAIMDVKHDIRNIEDIKELVNNFYKQIQQDELLGPIFSQVIQNRWDIHLEKMYRFWQTILLNEYTYFGSPFLPHAHLPIDEEHFVHWLGLFYSTVDRMFIGEKANEAKWRAEKMATMFAHKIAHIQQGNSKPLL
ncbi:group III truncated hemoglobin [Sphingobacterium sp. SRCM116780]|uniref:group III truncated hemoglobin n=1 Tax=Sphingobacterium sp. SRCM116780 TaxID=2907623 RepID=UPI001F2A3430|nr:group III truncated hemoglobin [Sphingobacterium sp. SRCM116780]UIR56686.1 group III truncated hemoglobin [Sphingobacterium sp. SRCM116780]